VIDVLVDGELSVKQCCEILGTSGAGFYLCRNHPMSPTKLRSDWLREIEQLLMVRRRCLDAGPRD
jgi:hypothetical protein